MLWTGNWVRSLLHSRLSPWYHWLRSLILESFRQCGFWWRQAFFRSATVWKCILFCRPTDFVWENRWRSLKSVTLKKSTWEGNTRPRLTTSMDVTPTPPRFAQECPFLIRGQEQHLLDFYFPCHCFCCHSAMFAVQPAQNWSINIRKQAADACQKKRGRAGLTQFWLRLDISSVVTLALLGSNSTQKENNITCEWSNEGWMKHSQSDRMKKALFRLVILK